MILLQKIKKVAEEMWSEGDLWALGWRYVKNIKANEILEVILVVIKTLYKFELRKTTTWIVTPTFKKLQTESSEKGYPNTPAHFDIFFKDFARSAYRGLRRWAIPHENYVTKCAVVLTFDLMEVLKKALEYSSDC